LYTRTSLDWISDVCSSDLTWQRPLIRSTGRALISLPRIFPFMAPALSARHTISAVWIAPARGVWSSEAESNGERIRDRAGHSGADGSVCQSAGQRPAPPGSIYVNVGQMRSVQPSANSSCGTRSAGLADNREM